MVDKTPQLGQRVPDFELPDSAGTMQRLSRVNERSALALIFYRGHW